MQTAMGLSELQTKEWITSRELALLLDKSIPAARIWAWRNGIKRSPSDRSLISRSSVDVALRRGKGDN